MRGKGRSLGLWAAVGVVTLLVFGPGEVAAQEVTYARDVAPIIQQNCQECHMEGSIAPIHLTNYDETRRYARRIRAKVADRIMPPQTLTQRRIQSSPGTFLLSDHWSPSAKSCRRYSPVSRAQWWPTPTHSKTKGTRT